MGDRGGVDDLADLLPAQCGNAHLDTWDRHLSFAFSSTKGLRNAPGENNCFVNCAVQVFWHLDVFRRSYRRLSGHTCMGNSCIFCALKVIFTQFQYSDKSSLHPDALRKALAETFANQQRFQLGHMDDAAECFENILRRLHFHVASNFNEDACTAGHCLPHQKFSMSVQEKVLCVCGAGTSPLKFHEMVHYVSASALLAQSRLDQSKDRVTHTDRFGLLLRRASAMGDVRNCPANCGKQVQKQRTLLNIPDVVSVGLVWDSDRPSVETTTEVAKILGTSILLPDMYHHVMTEPKKLPLLQLVAVVCYYGKHYSTFVLHSKLKTWIYFDDATVREIGPLWSNVVDKCSRGRFQPLLLLYANDNAVPVSVDNAPQRRVMATGYTPAGTSENGSSDGSRLDRTHESIKSLNLPSSRRGPTPTPNHPHNTPTPQLIAPLSPDNTGRDSPARLAGRDHVRQPSFLTAMSKDAARNKPGDASEGVRTLPGGAAAAVAYKPNSRRQLLDGGANSGHLDPMVEEVGDYADYTLSSGDQYRRQSPLGVEAKKPLPMPPNTSHAGSTSTDDSRKVPPASWKNSGGKEKGRVDVVRYQADPGRGNSRGTPDLTSKACDPSLVPGAAASKGGSTGPYRTASGHPGLDRCASSVSGREERSGGGGVWAGGQHVVVKPTPTPHAQQEVDCRSASSSSRTPVQSGLATLPRHHQGQHLHHQLRHHEPPTHPRGPSSSSSPADVAVSVAHREVAQLSRRPGGSPRNCSPIMPPGTPPPEYESVVSGTVPTYPHQQQLQLLARQPSTSSHASTIRSSLSMGNLQQLGSGKVPDNQLTRINRPGGDNSGKAAGVMKKSESSSEGLTGGKSSGGQEQYIDRRMVETILKHQGVHRHGSSCSNSSVDSDSVLGKMGKQSSTTSALKVDIPLDTLSLSSLKDSGCGSSDRHSSSSTGSGSVDQFPQCFLTKSMIVPRSLNPAHSVMDQHVAHFTKGHPHHTTPDSNRSSPRSVQSSHSGTRAGSPQVTMQPIRESTQEDALKPPSPNEPIGTKKFIMATPADASHSSEPRPPPIPPKNFAQFQIIKSSHSQLPAPHERMSSLENLMKEENVSSNFVWLCKKADVLMDKCVMAENKQDVSSALHNGEEALGCLKEAMTHKELNSKAQAYLQRKHNNCLIKVHTLQKRAPASRQESHSSGIGSDVTSSVGNSRSSITSSDSDFSDQVLRQQTNRQMPGRYSAGPPPVPRPRLPPPHPHTAPPSLPDRARDACRQGPIHVTQGQSVDANKGYCSSVVRPDGGQGGGVGQNQIPLSRQYHGRTDSCSSSNSHAQQIHGRTDSTTSSVVSSSHASDYVSVNSISAGDNSNTAEVYGTLPRNKSRNPGSGTGASAEMYQAFLNKQKTLQSEVRLSQQSLDSCKSDAGSVRSDAGYDNGGNKMNRSQIRQLLQDSIVQRQWHQPGYSGKSSPVQQQSASVQQNNSAHDYRTHSQQPQPTSSVQQQHSSYTQQPKPSSSHPQSQQHRQQRQQPPPAGYHHHSAGGGPVPGPRAPPPSIMPAGRPRTPTCASPPASCANPANNAPPSHSGSGALGKSSVAQNVARVTPYSHLQDAQVMRPCSGNSYLVMMHGPSQQQNNSQSSAASRGGSQGHPPPASRPLEQSASQSDCRSLGNGAHSTEIQ